MQSSNPVFTRAAGFNGRSTTAQGDTLYDGPGFAAGSGSPTSPMSPVVERRMTIDSVVQRTGLTLVVLVITAAITWLATGDLSTDPNAASSIYALAMIGSGLAFVLSLVNSFKRVVSPGLVLVFSAAEGVAIGGLSKIFEAAYPGVVLGAVLGTVAALVGTLTAYKVLNISVSDKFRKGVIAAMFGFVGLVFLDLILGFFHASLGFNGLGGMGLLFSVVGLVLGVFMLILDFDFVEKGIAYGLPEQESWRAAFGLTVSLVWIYINLLRILAIFRN